LQELFDMEARGLDAQALESFRWVHQPALTFVACVLRLSIVLPGWSCCA
jgi:hypothetical protein